ncbi:MAG: hypothetical protein M4579_005171 [Chaenotheca gracillima]|nr:MAG: hypothetical protein M4579_005171 [Chaenotheca gracillima]
MLGSHRFAEGVAISDAHAALRARGIQPSEAPIDALPRIEISDVGQVMMATGDGSEEAGQDPMLDFLRILHGEEDLFYSSSRLGKRPTTAMLLTHIANLAVMADRFGCVPCVAMYLKEKDVFHLVDSRTRVKGMAKTGEESPRQKILVGWVFDVSDWFFASSVRLVIGGSSQWTVALEGLVDPDQRGLWWHLPDDVEAELLYRRERILDVLNSLQMHFIGLYTSRERQCKLGYDSSPQCDSFQLGEMIRFFTRVDTIKMQGKLTPDAIAEEDAELDGHTGDIERLIVTMRQCPSYQIDRNHTHCGIRTKLIPALDYIQALVICESGLCRQCWVDDRANYRWSEREPAGHWTFRRNATATTPASSSSATGAKGQSKERPCKSGHRIARALFTASTRDWNPKP